MATATETRVKPMEGELRFLLPNIGWEGYETLLKLVGDNPGIRISYARGDAELMSPLIIHERFKKLLGRMVETMTEELDIQCVAAGSTTFNSQPADRGLEPDECYYLANANRLRKTDRVDLAIDPPPDLAIEVEITGGLLNKFEIYARLMIPEVWHHDGETLRVLLLGPDGVYAQSETSAALPFVPMDEIARFLLEYDPTNDTRWARAFRAWVRDVLLARAPGEGE